MLLTHSSLCYPVCQLFTRKPVLNRVMHTVSEDLFATNILDICQKWNLTMHRICDLFSYDIVSHVQSAHAVTAECSFTFHPDWWFSPKKTGIKVIIEGVN